MVTVTRQDEYMEKNTMLCGKAFELGTDNTEY